MDGLLQGRRASLGGPVDPDAALAAVLAADRKGRGSQARARGSRPAIGPGPSWAEGSSRGGFLDLVSDALDFLGN